VTHPFGYSVHAAVFGREEMERLSQELDGPALPRTRAGARHVLVLAAVRTVTTDPRLVHLAQPYVGAAPVPYRATLFDKSSASNWLVTWHQDLGLPMAWRTDHPAWGPWSIKAGQLYAIAPAEALERIVALRVHLDDSTATNGPLRVLPGTHDRGVLEDAEVQRLAVAIASVDCLCPAGGVVAMRPLAVHASSKAIDGRRRRVLHIEYAASLDIAEGIRLARA
jgi:ectoine hydroxylase-related dioxygenase (phytanoyl-CoA dioxygenase family)